MEKIISSKRLTPLFALICAFLWGCGFSVTKTGYSLFAVGSVPDKILFAGIRFILAGVMTLICRISTGKIDLKAVRTSFTKIVLLSMFQTVFQYAFLYIALSELSGSVSSVLNQLGSFLLALLLPLADRNERMSACKIAGCLLGFSGLVLINLNGFHLEFSLGTAAIIISSCSAAIGYLLSHKLSESLDPVTSTGCQQLLGGIILTLSGLLSGGQILPQSPAAIGILLYLAFSIASAYVIWSVLLKYNPVSEVAVYKFAVPVFGVLSSAVLLGENIFTPRIMLSLAAVAAGIALVNCRKKAG